MGDENQPQHRRSKRQREGENKLVYDIPVTHRDSAISPRINGTLGETEEQNNDRISL